jgi:Transcription factor/nuclear export subunit protein 2.
LITFSPLLYVTFWSLSMYDLYTPSDRYEEEICKLKRSINGIDDSKEFVSIM